MMGFCTFAKNFRRIGKKLTWLIIAIAEEHDIGQ